MSAASMGGPKDEEQLLSLAGSEQPHRAQEPAALGGSSTWWQLLRVQLGSGGSHLL